MTFCITGILLLLYANGERYDAHRKKIITTGSINIQTNLKGADIYINDERSSIQTPDSINNLLPNIYKITIKKEGYFPWEKNLSVIGGKATIIENVLLFQNIGSKKNILTHITTQEKYPNENSWLIVTKDNENKFSIHNFNAANEQIEALATLKTQPIKIIPINKKHFVVEETNTANENEFFIYSPQKNETSLQVEGDRKIHSIENIISHPSNPNIFFLLSENSLWQFTSQNDITRPWSALPVAENVQTFILQKNKLYILRNKPENTQLLSGPMETPQTFEAITELPQKNYTLTQSGQKNSFFIEDKKNNEVSLFKNDELQKIPLAASNAQWDANNKNILLNNAFEAWNYIPGEKSNTNTELITRQSSTIQNILWHPKDHYIFISDTEGIHIIELDQTDCRQTFTISNIRTSDMTINTAGDTLYAFHDGQLDAFTLL